jgi:hypothetical protein
MALPENHRRTMEQRSWDEEALDRASIDPLPYEDADDDADDLEREWEAKAYPMLPDCLPEDVDDVPDYIDYRKEPGIDGE